MFAPAWSSPDGPREQEQSELAISNVQTACKPEFNRGCRSLKAVNHECHGTLPHVSLELQASDSLRYFESGAMLATVVGQTYYKLPDLKNEHFIAGSDGVRSTSACYSCISACTTGEAQVRVLNDRSRQCSAAQHQASGCADLRRFDDCFARRHRPMLLRTSRIRTLAYCENYRRPMTS